MFTPGYLIIGHIAKDKTPDGPILGGTCSYSALTAHRLGEAVALVTGAGPDIPPLDALRGIQVECLPHPHSTTFENIYFNGSRQQKWWAKSRILTYEDIPPAWRRAPIVHLAPLSQEMSPSLCGRFPNSLVGVTMQGWLRGTDAASNVIYQPHPDLDAWLSHIDVLVMSRSDVFGDGAALTHFLTSVKVGVETLGPDGCRIFHNGQVTHVPVERNEEVDPTGAGDIFAAAFFIKYHQTKNCVQAAQFANACASLSVGRVGLNGVPARERVAHRAARLYSLPEYAST